MWSTSARGCLIIFLTAVLIPTSQQEDDVNINIVILNMKSPRSIIVELIVCYDQWSDTTILPAHVFTTLVLSRANYNESVQQEIGKPKEDEDSNYCSDYVASDIIFDQEITYILGIHTIDGKTEIAKGMATFVMKDIKCEDPLTIASQKFMKMTCPILPTSFPSIRVNSGLVKAQSSTSSDLGSLFMLFETMPAIVDMEDIGICETAKDFEETVTNTTICFRAGPGKELNDGEQTISSVKITYSTSQLECTVDEGREPTTYDLIAHQSNTFVGSVTVDNSTTLSLEMESFDPAITLNYVMFVNDTYSTGSVLGYDLFWQYLSGDLLEAGWIFHEANDNKYEISSTDDGNEGPINVYCTGGPYCYGYFIGATEGATGGADPVTMKLVDTENIEIEIISNVNLNPPSIYNDIIISAVNIRWSLPDGVNSQVSVCITSIFEEENYEQYHLVLIDSEGHYRQLHGAAHTIDGANCFQNIKLDNRSFDVKNRVTIIATKRDMNHRTILNSGFSDVFFIAPSMEVLNKDTVKVRWNNPGDYTFTVRKLQETAPIITNLTCNNCNYAFKAGEEDVVIVETEDSQVKVTATVELNNLTNLVHILEVSSSTSRYIYRPLEGSTSLEICFDKSSWKATKPSKDDVHLTCDTGDTNQYSMPATGTSDTTNDVCAQFDPTFMGDPRGNSMQCVFVVNSEGSPSSIELFDIANLIMPYVFCSNPASLTAANLLQMTCERELVMPNDPGKFLIMASTKEATVNSIVHSKEIPSVTYLLINSTIIINEQEVLVCETSSNLFRDNPSVACVALPDGVDFPETDLAITGVKLEYRSPDTLSLTLSETGNNNFDLLAFSSINKLNIGSIASSSIPIACELTDYETDRTQNVKYTLVNYYNGSAPASSNHYSTGSVAGYNLIATELTDSTVEVSWLRGDLTSSSLTIPEHSGATFTTANVQCVDSEICLGYFLGADNWTSPVTLLPIIIDPQVKIVSQPPDESGTPAAEVIIHRIMKVLGSDNLNQASSTYLQIQVESKVDIQDISLINLIVIHMVDMDKTADQMTFELVEPNNLEANKPKDLTFTVSSSVLTPDQDTALLVRMSHTNSSILGYGETSLTVQDISSTSAANVGGNTEFNITHSLRIKDCQPGLSVNNKDCSSTSLSTEYFLHYSDIFLDPVLVCYRGSGSPSDVLQCDQTQPLIVSEEMTNAGAMLTRLLSSNTTLEITNYSSKSEGEIVYYNPVPPPNEPTVEEVIRCVVEGDNCKGSATSIGNMDDVFNILAVDISDDSMKSLDFSFEDYQVSVHQITVDALEVIWSARDNTVYQCNLPENSSTAWDHDTVNCGNQEPCDLFFIQLNLTDDTLLATVRKEIDTDLRNVVGREFILEKLVETPSRNATLRLYVNGQRTLLEVCPDELLQTNLNYTLAVVDMLGHHLKSYSYSDSYTASCFSLLDVAALVTHKLRVMVYSNTLRQNSRQKAHVPLSTDVYLLDSSKRSAQSLQISQISGQTVRASWHNMNSMDVSYQVKAAGKTMDVICEARKDCDAYIHLDGTPTALNISLTENNQGTVQVVNTEINLSNISD